MKTARMNLTVRGTVIKSTYNMMGNALKEDSMIQKNISLKCMTMKSLTYTMMLFLIILQTKYCILKLSKTPRLEPKIKLTKIKTNLTRQIFKKDGNNSLYYLMIIIPMTSKLSTINLSELKKMEHSGRFLLQMSRQSGLLNRSLMILIRYSGASRTSFMANT